MKNENLQATWDYHNGTKHSYESIRRNPHTLDWENQPIPFKIYSDLKPIPLPQNLSSGKKSALEALAMSVTAMEAPVIPSLQTLAEILFFSAGITRRKQYPGGEILFRAAACTGALYHIDLYIVCGDLPGLDAGVYHFGPHDFALRQLRPGDCRGILMRATANEPAIAKAPLIVVSASTYWRNAWKYQARAYRHCYWDNGTILANLLAAAAVRHVPAKVVVGFQDGLVNDLLGLHPVREGALTLTTLGNSAVKSEPSFRVAEPLICETMPLSKKEIDYPAIRAMHEASSLESETEVSAWRKRGSRTTPSVTRAPSPASTQRTISLQPYGGDEGPRDTFEEVVRRRGSTREFAREAISFRQFSTMLDRAIQGITSDFCGPDGAPLNDIYMIVNAVENLPAGAYVLHREARALELLKKGDFRREAGYLGLGQEIPADCSVALFFLTDLDKVLGRLGNRGYRAAQLEASIAGGKLYLAAYAQGLGASGLTFFDDDVTEFFSPHAAGKSVMFLIALGRSVKRRS
jgi:SagB-type dehydrogenase family enzyme